LATQTSVWSPAGNKAGGGNEGVTKVAALAITTASSTIAVGPRTKILVTCVPAAGATAQATSAVTIRFTLSSSSASATGTATDFGIPINQPMSFDMGDMFDTIGFYNTNSTTGQMVDIYVLVLSF
jgi:hypothetical protein